MATSDGESYHYWEEEEQEEGEEEGREEKILPLLRKILSVACICSYLLRSVSLLGPWCL